jgi:hypothetical protein
LRWSAAAAGYGLLACLITWPLPRHLRDALLGSPSGDTGVYVWNLWIFRHELLRHGHLPFSTSHVFGYTGGTDLSLHNYAPIAGALGLPLIGPLGVVGAFNVILLFAVALSGLGTFVLARRLGLRHAAAWAAGALFMASPVLVARQTAHFSLVIAAALPLFLWALLRTLDRRRVADAIITGAVVAAAFFSDAYYGIYCVMMGGFVVGWRFTRVEWRGRAAIPAWVSWALNLAIAGAGTLIVWRLLSVTTRIAVGSIMIGLQTMYTPVLWLVGLVAVRAWLRWRPVVIPEGLAGQRASLARLGLIAVGVCLVLLWPVILGIAVRAVEGRLPDTTTYWRSSPQGVDMLAYLVPNPNHAWFGDRTRQWFMPDKSDAFPEFVGSFSIVALAVVAVAAWLRALPRLWVAFTGFFVLLSLGPFVHVGGINTYVIGPWALLRYVPVIGMARSPSRFAVVAVLGMSLLFAFAVQELARRRAPLRRAGAGILAAALMFELIPAPRQLHSAAVPDVYRLVAATGDDSTRLLELPTGIRDGTSSLGDFNASTAFFQTGHRRPLIGGYLSRVSPWRQREKARGPMMRALLTLSEGGTLSPERRATAVAARAQFLKRACIGFVIVNKARASGELQSFAVDVLQLTLVREDPAYALFRPTNPPPCDPPSPRRRLGAWLTPAR